MMSAIFLFFVGLVFVIWLRHQPKEIYLKNEISRFTQSRPSLHGDKTSNGNVNSGEAVVMATKQKTSRSRHRPGAVSGDKNCYPNAERAQHRTARRARVPYTSFCEGETEFR